MQDKRYYWIKLRTDFFNKKEIDFLLSQKNGCEYIVLYQMLCLSTANNSGEMVTKMGEMIVPYDIEKIVRDTKYFDTDTVVVALELFKKLGLIYQEQNNILKISEFNDMVGSECSSAKRVREYREKKALQCNNNVTQEYRDKSIEYRDKNIDINNNKYIGKETLPSSHEIEKSIIDYLNLKTNKHFKHTQNNLNKIKTRFKDGFTKEDFKIVIDKKVKEWINDDKMNQYLRPETLFGSKFESYLNQKEDINEPEWFNKEIDKKNIQEEDRIELEDMFKEFR